MFIPFNHFSKQAFYQEQDMTEYLRIGTVTSPHGVHGEFSVYPTTDDLKRFQQVKHVVITTKTTREEMEIQSVKYFKGLAILKLSGVKTRDDAEKYRAAEIWIHRSQTPKEEGKHLICDLLEMEVVNEAGEKIGDLVDVLQTGANDVFVVKKTDGTELLLPNIPSCILNVDEEAKKITVYVLPGLED